MTSFRRADAGALVLTALLAVICEASPRYQVNRPDLKEGVEAYEKNCVLTMRMLNVVQGTYEGGDAEKGYARTLKQLGPSGAGILADADLASGEKDGYRFRLIPQHTAKSHPVSYYSIIARPIKRLTRNQRSYFTDETGVIRFTSANRAPTVADPPIDSKEGR